MDKISIVVPVYNANETIEELVKQIKLYLFKITDLYEIILVDDFSTDNSWSKIIDLANNDKNIIGIKLSKNYGLDVAVSAGVEKSSGKYVSIIFCDLQDPIDKLPEMYKILKNDSTIDVVCSFFTNRHSESALNKLFSKIFWRLFSFFIKSHYPEEEGLYRIITRKAVNFYLQHNKTFRHIKILNDTGLKKVHLKMEENLRQKGKSGFTVKKKIEFAIDYLTTYSYRPLLYSSFLGFLFSFVLLTMSISLLVLKIFGILPLTEWTTLTIFLTFLSSLIFLNLAIIAVYLGKNIEESKNSPSYFIDEHINF